MKATGQARESAFTLIEILAVATIAVILMALLVPVTISMFGSKDRAVCASNLRQIGALVASYAAENQGELPPSGANGLFSFVGQINPELTWQTTKSSLFSCPADKTGGKCSYSIVENSSASPGTYKRFSGNPGEPYLHGQYRLPVFPRPSKTFLIVEAPNKTRTYLFSGNSSIVTPKAQFDTGGPFLHEKKGANYLFLDGHVAFIETPLDPDKPWPSQKRATYDQWAQGFQAQ